MPVVLIPTSNSMILPGVTPAYARLGYDVVVGTENFFLKLLTPDLVHYLWPEEFARWKLPKKDRLDKIRGTVEWWASRCPTVTTVSNLYPHGFERNALMKELYEIFYRSSTVILHHSHASHQLVHREFPASHHTRHVVSNYYAFKELLPAQLNRNACRRFFGYREQDFVILVFGALRSWAEVTLIQKAFAKVDLPRKRLLMGGRYLSSGRRWHRVTKELRWTTWLRLHGARPTAGYIPDAQVHRYLEAADVILVPRVSDMTSGLVGLGLTFGTTIIAPNHGAYPEYLAGTGNLLYESGSHESLAHAIERAASLDRSPIAVQNRALADQWNWLNIVRACTEAVGQYPSPCRRTDGV